MAVYHVFYNPVAGDGNGETKARGLDSLLKGELHFYDLIKTEGVAELVNGLAPSDAIVVAGGDGTLNHFINEVDCDSIPNRIYYYATGTGNDFLRDVAGTDEKGVVEIGKYLKHLPQVEVNGKKYLFLNGVGYGIDGYCCEVGDKLRETSDKPVNYAGIAIKGLLFHYKPTAAKVTVDGVEHSYRKVWIAPTMHGRFYGGGMMPAPRQRRDNEKGTVSVTLFHDSGKLPTLAVFPNIFKGTIEKSKKMIDVFEGKDITVEFSEPRALQIDGETILGVTKYHVICDRK